MMTSLLCLLLSGAAHAGGIHAGLSLIGWPDLGEVELLGPDLGRAAPILDQGRPIGVVRVYVGPTEAAAAAWVEDQARAVQRPLAPLEGLGDAAAAAGDAVVLVREGNVGVGVLVAEGGGALARARELVAAIADAPAGWPAAAAMRVEGELTFFEVPPGITLQVDGGRRPLGEAWGFVDLPSRVVAWDAWGRATVLLP